MIVNKLESGNTVTAPSPFTLWYGCPFSTLKYNSFILYGNNISYSFVFWLNLTGSCLQYVSSISQYDGINPLIVILFGYWFEFAALLTLNVYTLTSPDSAVTVTNTSVGPCGSLFTLAGILCNPSPSIVAKSLYGLAVTFISGSSSCNVM